MDIQKEKNAFLSVYVRYQGDSRKIQFNEENEQFMWRKNNVSDSEVEYVHFMNQRWYAWLACAKSKANAVPEGFVLVPKEKIESLVDGLHSAFQSNPTLTLGDLLPLQQDFQAIIESQEQSND